MSRFPKPCLICGQLSKERLCSTHLALEKAEHEARRAATKRATGQYSGSYHKRAKEIRENSTHCYICGGMPTLDDPLEADHINPAEHGETAILLPAHRSCNRKKSNKPINN